MNNITRTLLRIIEILIILLLIVLSLHLINSTFRKIYILENIIKDQEYIIKDLKDKLQEEN